MADRRDIVGGIGTFDDIVAPGVLRLKRIPVSYADFAVITDTGSIWNIGKLSIPYSAVIRDAFLAVITPFGGGGAKGVHAGIGLIQGGGGACEDFLLGSDVMVQGYQGTAGTLKGPYIAGGATGVISSNEDLGCSLSADVPLSTLTAGALEVLISYYLLA